MFQLSLSTILTSPTTPGAEFIPALSGDFSAALAGAAEASGITAGNPAAPAAPRQAAADGGKSLPTAPGEESVAADLDLAWLGEPALPGAAPVRLVLLNSAATAASPDANPALPQPAAAAPGAEIGPRGSQPARGAAPIPAMPHPVAAVPVAVAITTSPSAPGAQPFLATGGGDAAPVSTMPANVSVIAAAPAPLFGATAPAPTPPTMPQSPIQVAAAPGRRLDPNGVQSEDSQDAALNTTLPAGAFPETPQLNFTPDQTDNDPKLIQSGREDHAAATDSDAAVAKRKDKKPGDGSDTTPADTVSQPPVFAVAFPPNGQPAMAANPEARPSVTTGLSRSAAPVAAPLATIPAGPFAPSAAAGPPGAPTLDAAGPQAAPAVAQPPATAPAAPPSYSAHEADRPSRIGATEIRAENPSTDAMPPLRAAASPAVRPMADLSPVQSNGVEISLTAPVPSVAPASVSAPAAAVAPRVAGTLPLAAHTQLAQTAAAPDRPTAPLAAPAQTPLQPSAQPAAASGAPIAPVAVLPSREVTAGAPQPPITRLAAETATKTDIAPPANPSPPAPARPAPAPQPAQPAAIVLGVAFGGGVPGQRPLGGDRSSPREQALQALTALGGAPATPIAATSHTQHGALDMQRQDWPQAMIDRIEALRDAADATSTRITLAPDALGKVDLSIRHDGDAVHVHFSAEAAQTRAILADAQPKLAELAQQRGLRLGQATVDAGTSGGGQRQQPQVAPPLPPRPASMSTTPSADQADAADPTRLA